MRDALAIIDVQRDYCLPDGALGRMGRDMTPTMALVERIGPFAACARRTGIPVVVVRSETPTLCQPGSPGADLCFVTAESDLIITKHTYGAFHAPEIRDRISALKPDRLVVTGVDTRLCVESTVRQAFDLGYRVEVVRDLVATRGDNRLFHEASLAVMGKYFATLTDSETVMRRWAEAAAAADPAESA